MDYYNNYYSEDYLMHYGVKGMKWGHRKRQAFSIGAAGHRAMAKVYDINAKAYKKSNKALSSMNAQARNQQLKSAEQAQAIANAKKEARNTPEAKAAKIGAAVAGTALAAYGAKKLNDYVKANHTLIEAKRGREYSEKMFEQTFKRMMDWEKSPITPGTIRETVTLTNNSGRDAMDVARQASRDNFVTAAKNVVDYRRQNGKNALRKLGSLDSYTTGLDQTYKFTKGR